jgi:hypothetical protein
MCEQSAAKAESLSSTVVGKGSNRPTCGGPALAATVSRGRVDTGVAPELKPRLENQNGNPG